MGEEWKKLRQKIESLQTDLTPFEVVFLDQDGFKKFFENLRHDVGSPYRNVYITGYFSETTRKTLETIIKMKRTVRLISPEFPHKKGRDKKNLQVLQKLADAGAEIKFNNRLHARFLVAYTSGIGSRRGLLLIGSFDFNRDCIGLERHDAGIKTTHPDLVESAIELFEQIWNERESVSLEDFIQKERA